MGFYKNYKNADSHCKKNGGSIGTIRDENQLKALENIARKYYKHTYVSAMKT